MKFGISYTTRPLPGAGLLVTPTILVDPHGGTSISVSSFNEDGCILALTRIAGFPAPAAGGSSFEGVIAVDNRPT